MTSTSRKLDAFSSLLSPATFTLFLIFLSAVPKRIMPIGDFMPMFGAIAIFYWGVFKPRRMPYWFLFVLGIVQDALYNTPALGISSLGFLLFRFLVTSQRRLLIKEAFWAVWVGFVGLSLLFAIFLWMVSSLYYAVPMPMGTAILQWSFTGILYPLFHMMFTAMFVKPHDHQSEAH